MSLSFIRRRPILDFPRCPHGLRGGCYACDLGDYPALPPDFVPSSTGRESAPYFPPFHELPMNHPSRSPTSPHRSPTPPEIRAGRLAAKLRPDQAGELIHERASRWLAFEVGEARMHAASWELFKLKTGQV